METECGMEDGVRRGDEVRSTDRAGNRWDP